MSKDLAAKAELLKLARALNTEPDAVAFADSLDAAALHQLREAISGSLYDEHRGVYQRIAAASKLLPAPMTAKIAEHAFPPLISARVAAELGAERAADLASRLPVDYLADVCIGLDPRKVARIIERIPLPRAVEVATELVRRDEFITLGRLIDAATREQLRGVAAEVDSDEALLWIGFYAESPQHLTEAIKVLPDERIRRIVHTALDGPAELHSAGLALMSRVDDARLRRRLGDMAAECAPSSLTALIHTAVDEGFLPEILTVFASMSEESQRSVMTLDVLAEQEVLVALVRATAAADLWDRLLPLVEYIDDELRARLAALVTEFDDDVLRSVIAIAQRDRRWSDLLPLIGSMTEPGRRRVAGFVSELTAPMLRDVVDSAHQYDLWPQLFAVAEYLDADAVDVVYEALGETDQELLAGDLRALREVASPPCS